MNVFDHESGKLYSKDDVNIYYETKGSKNLPALLLLHGGFGSIEDFNSILSLFTKNYYVIGVDCRGQGKSTSGQQKPTYELYQHDIESVLQSLQIKTLNIIGFSDGGIVAYRLTAFSDLNIEKLVTIGSRWQVNDALRTKEVFLKITPESWKNKFPDTYNLYQRLNPEPNFDKLTKNMIAMWLDEGSSGYPNIDIKNFRSAALIIRGDDDHLTTAESLAQLKGLLKNGHFLNIPYAGHAAFVDQTEIFKISAIQFLADKKSAAEN